MPIASLGPLRIHYQSRGEGFPVLGIMGFALDQRFWAAQIPAITGAHRFITFDNRGIGRSSGPPAGTIEDMAADAGGLLDHLGIDRAIVVGASMGGAIAQRLALAHPERVQALVLAVTWARPIEFMRRQSELARSLIEAGGAQDLVDASLLWMFTPRFFEIGGETIDRMVRGFMAESGPEAADPAVLNAQLDAIGKHDCLAALGSISCPTLVAGGRMDMMVPCFASEEIAAAVPGARLATFETGHGLMIEEMDAFNARLTDFLREVTP
ncbi:MAG: alpha/beta fold hydrolase [Actinomycetota bacterium]